jgi:hypothetical protein
MTLVHGAVTVCGLSLEEKIVAEIFNLENRFGWQISRAFLPRNEIMVKTGASSLREANLECLKWIKNNISLDISKIKTSSIVQPIQSVTAMSNYRNNFKRRTKLPSIHLTMPRLMKDPKWRASHA